MAVWTSRGDIDTFGVTHTESGIAVEPLYTASDAPAPVPGPAAFPFTRGFREDGYRTRPWTFRQYAGHGGGSDTNGLLKYMVENGQSGLSIALDLPTQMGLDSDDPRANYEVGRLGVAIDRLADMEAVYDGIPIERISSSFTINGTAPVILAYYVAMADRRGIPRDQLAGTVQNDLLKEFVARGAYLYPPAASVRLATDVIEFCMRSVPKWNAISISAAHMRSAGATPVMSDGFMLSNAIAYCESVIARGIDIDDFAPNLSFLTSSYKDVFETVARFRACRTVWAEIARDRFGAQKERSMMFRVHSGGDIDAMTSEEPINNVARMALNAFAGACGGVQSMQVPCYDEAYEIPTEAAILNALRVQHIVAYESGVRYTADPFAGSYFVEDLTEKIAAQLRAIIEEVTSTGGSIEWISDGRMQAAISQEARVWEERVADGSEIRVGLGSGQRGMGGDGEITVHEFDPGAVDLQIKRLQEHRATRDSQAVTAALAALTTAAEGDTNVMELLVEAAKAGATTGEMCGALGDVFGDFDAPVGI
ncbi:methylmalonyl-CoA mutase family protein [Aeromicrobium sp.]|uniref:methylmalonyl-CoA mutase family protein n=1 Tax=Aeromicrobium sp. TaxID=1871063 RepID=UPI0025C2EC7C|nr:methylmalonyl-CoA mutase family protein [Aeromicrobium sp.]MCK5892599.1 methylmalonyl-CoA mutase [Aeromicrobium sp.]